jgi:superfamily I DNA and RNA helicase
MDFIWSEPGETNYAEKAIWDALKLDLIKDEGICYHRYPIFSADRSRREPDILILHRQWGLYIIECKGCKIDNIERIDGPAWIMKDWHSSKETPYTQAEDQMWAVLGKFRQESALRRGREDLITGHVFIGLPFITRREWEDKGLDLSPAVPSTIIFADDLEPLALRKRLQEIPAEEKQEHLTDEQWNLALAVLQGAPVLRREPRPEPKKTATKAYLLREVEQQMLSIDREQHKVAVQIPSGPQRIRGLAGSGKTVVMCMKTAWMHSRYPSWDIAYTFYTRSLYGMIRALITRFYRYWVDQDPDWSKIHVFHGWGAKDIPGMYRSIAGEMRRSPRTYTEAKNIFSYGKLNELLGKCCKELLDSGDEIPQLFDAILIDEGQDFHFDFYRLCYRTLKEPKRLVWAYDEVQSLESLSIPTTIDIFGTNSDGSPIVSLDGVYPDGEVEKDMILYRCYRTPRPVLVTAHVFGMGLLRQKGAVQFIPTSGGWEDIGYEIVSGTFLPGQKLTIKRPEKNSPHALEKLVGYRNLVQWKAFADRNQELEWVANQIANDIYQDELKPEEILVISLDWRNNREIFLQLESMLAKRNVKTVQPGIDTPKEVFSEKGHVTLTGIFPAKGNESSIVYVIGFEQVGSNPRLIVQERNQAFTAMTRTRGWCILTGVGKMVETLFGEIGEILKNPEEITFTVPDPKTIQRNLDSLEYEKRRKRIQQVEELTAKLARVLAEVDDPNLRKKTIEKLQGTSST